MTVAADEGPPSVGTTNKRGRHETRSQAEACPRTVDYLIGEAHRFLARQALQASPAKVSKLVRRYVRAQDDGATVPPFEAFLVNAVSDVVLQPIRGARNAFGVVDEPGETVARRLDDTGWTEHLVTVREARDAS